MKYDFLRLCAVATVVVSISFLTGGCAQTSVRSTDEGVGAAAGQHGEAMGAEESLSTAAKDKSVNSYSEGRTSSAMLPVYFDFDQSNIRKDQKGRIEGNAYYLKNHAGSTVRIEGNCDERGTNEYNMALGERRAMASKKYLLNMGISEDRLQTVSYGEEKPLLYGHDELSWAQNRRDDFVITK